MKKVLLLVVIFACCTMTMSAQDGIKVNFQGAAPDIMDFAWSWTSIWDDQENTPDESAAALRRSLECYRKGEAQPDGFTITVDKEGWLYPGAVEARRIHEQVGDVLLEHGR